MLNSRDLKDLRANVRANCEGFLAECKKAGLNVLVTQTLRDDEYQATLYKKGYAKTAKTSFHGKGLAFDICKNIKGHEYDDAAFFTKCAAIGKKIGFYKAPSDTTKSELLERCYRYSYEAAKTEVLGDGAVDKWVLHARNAKSKLGMSTADYLASLEKYGSDVMSGTGFEKTKRMLNAGLSLDDWAKMRGNVDADKNGSVKKAELTDYIESHFPKEQWGALFDAYKGGQNWKNPY